MTEHSHGPEIVLGCLSRGRLDSLRRAVNSALALAGARIHIFVAFDDDMASFQGYKEPKHVTKLLYSPRHYYTRGANRLLREMADTGADLVGLFNNDAEFVLPNWAVETKQVLFESFDEGMGVVEMSNQGAFSHFVTRVPFLAEFFEGESVFNEEYTQYWSDREALGKLEAAGRYVHPIPGFVFSHSKRDEVNAEGNVWYPRDEKTYYRRQAKLDFEQPTLDERVSKHRTVEADDSA